MKYFDRRLAVCTRDCGVNCLGAPEVVNANDKRAEVFKGANRLDVKDNETCRNERYRARAILR